jgi:hypothetical protein
VPVGVGGDGVTQIALRAANGQYVCAESGGGQEVVANRNEIGAWETFWLVTPPDSLVVGQPPGWGM